MNKIILISLVSFFFAAGVYAQTERLKSMGGLNYIIYDEEVSLNPYDLGGNPSWLYKDDTNSWLRIIPSVSGKSGEYKRRYDASSENNYMIDFVGLKTLGEDGTFLGETSYLYTTRKSVPRSLKYNPYSGEALFFTDTTTGDFRYNGPQVFFMYSLELFQGLYTGASIRYRILNGLKDRYSRAETMFRELEGNIGTSYQITNNLAAGVNYIYFDGQEKIESKSEDLLDVEVFNYFGDNYSTRSRTNTEQKIKNKLNSFSGQLYYRPDLRSEVSLTGKLVSNKQQILIPYSQSAVVSQSYDEFEEGYSYFKSSSLLFLSRYEIFQGIFVGVSGEYLKNYVWSKNSIKEKLLWEWNTEDISGGLGFSWLINQDFLLGVEYKYSDLQADSSKYIDNKSVSLESGNHLIKLGLEYKLFDGLKIRSGYNLNTMEKDIIYGGDNVDISTITFGLGINLIENIQIDFYLDYTTYGGIPENLKRSGYSAFTSVKLNTF